MPYIDSNRVAKGPSSADRCEHKYVLDRPCNFLGHTSFGLKHSTYASCLYPALMQILVNSASTRDQSTGPRLEDYKETTVVKNRKSSIPLKYTVEASVPTPYSILREV